MKKLILLLLFAVISKNISAAEFGKVVTKNCYQVVTGSLTSTQTFNFLNTPDGRNITVTSNNPLDILDVDLYYLDPMNNWVIFHSGLTLGSPYIINSSYSSIKIVPNNNPGSFGSSAQPVIINYVDPIITPTCSTPCLTFGANNFKLNLNLDGLCVPPLFKITLPASAPNRWGIPANWFLEAYDFPGTSSNSLNIPINAEFCQQHVLDQYGNIVSPCLTFNIEITLEPCHPSNCPNYVFNKPIEICCFCGSHNPTED